MNRAAHYALDGVPLRANPSGDYLGKYVKHAGHLSNHLVVLEPQHLDSLLRYPRIALRITNNLRLVDWAINLDDETSFVAVKVGDKRTKGMLPPNAVSERVVANSRPEPRLCKRHVSAQLTRKHRPNP